MEYLFTVAAGGNANGIAYVKGVLSFLKKQSEN
jgi:hypothetical protein